MFNQAQQQIVNLMTTNKHNKYKLLIRSYMGFSKIQRKRIKLQVKCDEALEKRVSSREETRGHKGERNGM